MKKIVCMFIVLGSIVLSVQKANAELRIWTDENGKKIEAEHVRTLDDKVVLKQVDGTEIKVSLDTLSEKDRRFAILQRPPRIDIKVSTDVDRDNKAVGPSNHGPGIQVQKETIQATVTLKKSSSAPYEAPLKAEVFLIAQPEKQDAHVILDRTESRFRFTAENKNEHVFTTEPRSLKQVEAGRQAGLEYEGYLVAVTDRTGEVLTYKCSKLDYERNAEAIMGGKRGSVFDKDFEPVDKQAKREAQKQKQQERQRNRLPGRRF